MGTRGPKPKPTKEKERLGNPGRRPLNDSEPEPIGLPEPPDYLDAYASEVWQRVILSMSKGVYTACDTELLASYCQACSLHKKAVYVNSHGRYKAYKDGIITNSMYTDTNGKDWIRIQKEQATNMASIGTRLGLDPAARTAIKIQNKKPKGKFGELTQIPGGKS